MADISALPAREVIQLMINSIQSKLFYAEHVFFYNILILCRKGVTRS